MDFGEKLEKMFGKAVGEIGQELDRMGVQGQAELGVGPVHRQRYVPYGQGQNRAGWGAWHGGASQRREGGNPARE